MLTTREQVKAQILGEIDEITKADFVVDQIESLADSEVPVYYGQIIEAWTALTNDESNRYEEIGYMPDNKTTIYKLMEIDLYLYYKDLFLSVYNEILDEKEKVDA